VAVSCSPRARRAGGSPGRGQLSLAAEIPGAEVAATAPGCRLRALAGCVLLDSAGRVLLLHRKSPMPRWELPGGKVEKGETSEAAAIRELHEELGLRVWVGDELGGARFSDRNIAWRYTWYLAEHAGTPIIREPRHFDDVSYFSLSALVQMTSELSPNVRILLTTYFDGRIVLPCRRHASRTLASSG